MVSRRIKYAMAHLSRQQYISLLARPNWRRFQRKDAHNLAHPFTISRAALKSRASRRIKIMAQPKYVTKKYDPAKASPQYPRIPPKTSAAKTTKRLIDLSLPPKRTLIGTLRTASHNKQIVANVTKVLSRLHNSRYQKYRVFCNAILQREARRKKKLMAKLRKALTKPEDWQRHKQVLEKLAAPRVIPKPKYPDRRKKWRPINLQRLEELAQPVVKEIPEVRDPFKVPASALVYKATSRINQLTLRKKPPEILPPLIPGTVSPAAMKAVASPRLVALAKPLERPAGMETDLREDAFTVSPAALKARCTKRLKNLARPKTYGKS